MSLHTLLWLALRWLAVWFVPNLPRALLVRESDSVDEAVDDEDELLLNERAETSVAGEAAERVEAGEVGEVRDGGPPGPARGEESCSGMRDARCAGERGDVVTLVVVVAVVMAGRARGAEDGGEGSWSVSGGAGPVRARDDVRCGGETSRDAVGGGGRDDGGCCCCCCCTPGG